MKKNFSWGNLLTLPFLPTKHLLIMKISILLTFVLSVNMMASVYSQKARFDMDIKNESIRDILKTIERESEFRFFYNDEFNDLDKKLTFAIADHSIDDVLSIVLDNTEVGYKILDNNFIVITPKSLYQQREIKGTVTDENGDPLPGVNILIEGTQQGVISDVSGHYSIEVPQPNSVLVFSYIGFNSERIETEGKSVIDVSLIPDIKNLDEVVVIGYGVLKKKLVTGATIEVKGDELTKRNTVSPLTALQSLTPGINIAKVSGEPGAGFKVTIRGIGTIGDARPLYIVDGVPRDDINYLTPSDIESIDVLKDAASAAIYGSRAANGVVMVTTRKGKAGKLEVTYDGSYGVQNLYKILPLLNAKEYLMIQQEARVNSNLPPYTDAQLESMIDPVYYQKLKDGTWNGTNWLKEMQNKNAPIQSHALNLTGGNETSVFSIGAAYTSQEGIFGYPVQSKYERYSFRLNSDHVLLKKNYDIIKVGENISFTYVKNHGIGTGNMWWNDILNCSATLPILPMYASDRDDPAYPYHSAIPYSTLSGNPHAAMIYNRGFNENENFGLTANAFMEIQPVKGLKYRMAYSVNPSAYSSRSWRPTYYLSDVDKSLENSSTQSKGSGLGSWMFENTLNYQFAMNDAHHFNIMVGTSAEKYGIGNDLSTTNLNSVFNDYKHAYITNAHLQETATISGAPYLPGSIASYFGRILYDYKETYMLSAVLRVDGSSRFARGHRWSKFPSVAAGWVITNESFMENTKSFLDFLKLRASWGQNGNERITPFQYLSQIGYTSTATNDERYADYYFDADKTKISVGAYPINIPTPNLMWETSEQLDLGLDARLLKSRLSLAFDYYIKTTKDWLVQAPVLASLGLDKTPYINGGEIKNKGVEIALGWSDRISDFNYGISGNLSYNDNEVTVIKNDQGIINAENVKLWGNGPYISRAQVGYPIGYFWGYKTAGIFQNMDEVNNYKNSHGVVIMPNALPGDVKFVDQNDDGVISDDDKVNIGDPNPDFVFALNLRADYKGFDFLITANGVAGNQIARMWRDAGQSELNYTTEILNRWHGEGTSNRIPRVTSGASINQQYTSDLQIENGDFLRISNVTLGYDIKKLMKIVPVKQLRLFLTVQNLHTFTKYSGMDPEIGTSTDDAAYGWARGVDLGFYPAPRTVLVGASVKF
jgi:TonB-dependent starch-binding outer membrane protein SusC